MKNARKLSLLSAAVVLTLGASAAMADPVAGTTSGVFTNPLPPSATTTITNTATTSTFKWGVGSPPPPSSMVFTSTSFNSSTETPFKIGTLNYFNGTITSSSGATSVDLSVGLNFTTPPSVPGTQAFLFTLDLINTPNSKNATTSADYVIFPTNFAPQTFMIDQTLYTLKITGFDNVTGDGFLQSSDTGFHVKEGGTGSADLFAEVTSDFTGSPFVPEPASLSVLGLGAAGLLLRRRRTKV